MTEQETGTRRGKVEVILEKLGSLAVRDHTELAAALMATPEGAYLYEAMTRAKEAAA